MRGKWKSAPEVLKPLIPDFSGLAAAGQRSRANPPLLQSCHNVLVGSVYLEGSTMQRFWRIRTFPFNSCLWKLESEAAEKKAHCGGIYRRSRTLFILYIAVLRGVPSTFQMAFTAQTLLPLTIAFRKSRPSRAALFTCCLPRSHLERGGRARFCQFLKS